MWDQTFKRWLDLVFWWLPKHEATEQPSAQAAEPAAPPAAASEPAPRAAEPATVHAPEPVAPAAKEPPAGRAPKQAAAVAASDRAPDDLTVIKGIGPVVQQKLHALGIRTFHDLAAADPGALVEQLKGRQPISETLVRGWTKAADQRTAARH
jgi:predicted flap endonuclease-1-like 5' DNA nuclease